MFPSELGCGTNAQRAHTEEEARSRAPVIKKVRACTANAARYDFHNRMDFGITQRKNAVWKCSVRCTASGEHNASVSERA